MSIVRAAVFFAVQLLVEIHVEAMDYRCNEASYCTLSRCIYNSQLQVTKSSEMYQIALLDKTPAAYQCYNNFCLVVDGANHDQSTLQCSDICETCRQLQPGGPNGNSCGTNALECEEQVDAYLNDFCAQAIATTERAIASATTMAEPACTTSTITIASPACTCSPTATPYHQNMNKIATSAQDVSIRSTTNLKLPNSVMEDSVVITAALAVLSGCSMVLLVLVTTGWVCTYVSMKKKVAAAKFNSDCTKKLLQTKTATESQGDKGDAQCDYNPSYEVITSNEPRREKPFRNSGTYVEIY